MNSSTTHRPADRKGFAEAGGFSLIELLVVVGVLGILAAIAMPQYATYKRRAVDSEMQSDLHHGRVAMEAYYVANQYTYTGASVATLAATYGYQATTGVTLELVSSDDDSFSMRSCAPNGTVDSYRYDSDGGVLIGEDVPCT